MYELPHDMPNNWRLEKLGISKKIPEKLVIDGEYLAGHPKVNFDSCAGKLQKISFKTFHAKTYFNWFREFVYNSQSKNVHRIIYME